MASMGGKVGSPNQAHYAASKAAVISAHPGRARWSSAPHGITVNCICPGYVLTEMGAATRTPEMVARVVVEVAARPARRALATSPTWPCSSPPTRPSYCTGQAMNVSGGMVMH